MAPALSRTLLPRPLPLSATAPTGSWLHVDCTSGGTARAHGTSGAHGTNGAHRHDRPQEAIVLLALGLGPLHVLLEVHLLGLFDHLRITGQDRTGQGRAGHVRSDHLLPWHATLPRLMPINLVVYNQYTLSLFVNQITSLSTMQIGNYAG